MTAEVFLQVLEVANEVYRRLNPEGNSEEVLLRDEVIVARRVCLF
jgi:hypothetical protein